MADSRGKLSLEYLRLANRARPRWLVWENVPGVLSSNGGRDFGAILGGMGELGYGFAYRVLDAQHFGVPQRRRRVFVVGYLGDWRRAAAVLFERHSLQGHPAPRRETGQNAPTIPSRSSAGGGRGTDFDCDGGLIQAFGGNNTAGPIDIATACNSHGGPHGGPHGRLDFESETFIAHSLRREGFDASEDGTGRGTPLVPVAFAQNSRDETRIFGEDGSTVGALAAEPGMKQQCYVAFSSKDHAADAGDISPTLRSMGHDGSHANGGGQVAVAFQAKQSASSQGPSADEVSPCLDVAKAGGMSVGYGSAVRHLTPRECERLQGFPDDFTAVPYRKGMMADGPRYKMLGNSMAVPCMTWIGERIALVDKIPTE